MKNLLHAIAARVVHSGLRMRANTNRDWAGGLLVARIQTHIAFA